MSDEYLPSAPSALVSWAHRDSGWDDDQAEAWISQVLQFSSLLVENGVNVVLDLWNDSDPTIDWTRWGPEQVASCDFVIIATSQAWKERWEGSNHPTQGAGAVAEANALKGRFNRDQEEFQNRTIIVLLPGAQEADIPMDLHHLFRQQVKELTSDGIEGTLRALFGSPRYERPTLGSQPAFSRAPHVQAVATPAAQDIASKRAELDSETDEGKMLSAVHFEKPAPPTPRELTPAEALSSRLDHQILGEVFKAWDADTELFKKVGVDPTRQLVIDALSTATHSGLISTKGPRVTVFDTDFQIRFELQENPGNTTLRLHLLSASGNQLETISWTDDLDVVQLLAIISQRIFEQPYFDGALGFFPSSIISGISELMVSASEGRKGWRMGARQSFEKLIQIVDDYWVVTDSRIFPKDRPYYTIAISRVDEMDWAEHIKGKRWNGESGIDTALAVARQLHQEEVESASASELTR